jgi:hypothetical protein
MNISTCDIIFVLAKHTFHKDGQLRSYLLALKKLIYKVWVCFMVSQLVSKVKFSPLQALEALRVVRGWGSHIF